MNKKFFTLMAAAFLSAGAYVVPASAAPAFESYKTVNANKKLANGVKFYMQKDNATTFYGIKEVTLKDKTKVWTLDGGSNSEAVVFEVANFVKVGNQFTFSLKADGKDVVLAKNGAIADGADLNSSNRTSTILVANDKLSDITSIPAFLNGATGVDVTLGTYVETLDAKALNEYNMDGFTFGFNAKTDLVGNAFAEPMYAVQQSGETYFVVGGTEKALKALKEDFKDGTLTASSNLFNKDIKVIALNKDKKYDVRAAKTAAYSLQVVTGDKVNTTETKGAFTVKEFDQLANPGEFQLTIEEPSASTTLYVGAMHFTSTDTKTYVTTVQSNEAHLLIPATLGASTYLDASVLLKEGAANYVKVYFTSNKESQKDDFQTEYHKYLAPIVGSTGFELGALAANDYNDNAAAQWAVSGFDGKYTFTLTNRETSQNVQLGLQESEVKGEYKIVNANSAVFGNLTTDVNDNSALSLNGRTVKFIPVEKKAGYLNLTEEQMKQGVTLEFFGESALIGKKSFFAAFDDAKSKLVPDMDASNAYKMDINKGEAKINNTDDKAVADYTINEITVAYLKSGKVVTAKDTLFVPTYNLTYTVVENNDDVTYYLKNNLTFGKLSETTSDKAEFVFRQNANGSYAMLAADPDVRFANDIVYNAKAVSVKTTTGNAFITDQVSFYEPKGEEFAYVNVKVNDNSDKTSLAAKPRHASFDNLLGSVNYQLNANGINEGILGETMTFWLDTADSKAATPSFYISRGIVEEGAEAPAYRMFMYNSADSLSIFDEGSAQASHNKNYRLEGTAEGDNIAKVIFRQAEIVGVDTISTTVDGKSALVAKKENKGKEILGGLDNFKFGICLADEAVEGEYIIYSKADGKYLFSLNGKLGLTNNDEKYKAMVFTLGNKVPTANESIEAESSVKVLGQNASVVVLGAAGKTVTVATVLGKRVASQVIASDNATIAAPAGVVFVTVDGETTKVVVK